MLFIHWNKVVSVFVGSILFMFPLRTVSSHSDTEEKHPQISPMETGQKAPFSGVLFSPAAAAQVLTDADIQQEMCKIETEK